MSHINVKTATATYLAANWSSTRILDWENLRSDLQSSMDPWVSVMYYGTEERQIGLGPAGPRYWREEGVIQLWAGVPAQSGWRTLDEYCNDLRNLFRGIDLSDSLVITKAGPPTLITEDRQVLGNWYVKAVHCDYIYTYTDSEVS